MKNNIILISVLILILIIIGFTVINFSSEDASLNLKSGPDIKPQEINPSQTFIEYQDPSGFSFSYPDNLSISKEEVVDTQTYADLQLFSKDVSGSLKLIITDSKLTSLDDWLKANQIPEANTPKEVKLGSLKALEVKTKDRLILGALDQGVLFTIELPLIEESFWMKVYEIVVSEFNFELPDAGESVTSTSTASDVIFEGEEVVE